MTLFLASAVLVSILILLTCLFRYRSFPASAECVLGKYSFMIDPPVSCSICEGVTEVPYLANVGPEDVEKLLAKGQPFVLTDAATNWTALKTFDLEFFRNLFRRRGQTCQFFNYKTSFTNVDEFFDAVSDPLFKEDWYVGWSNCDAATGRALRQHYGRPYAIPNDTESSKTDWIFMGMPGHGAHMHTDRVTHPSWQTQVKGRKKWIFRTPLECYFACPKSWFEVILEPGYTLVADTNTWYHATLVLDGDISISIGTEFDF